MRGGRNKKTVEQHLIDGTYRADRHGYVNTSDEESLKIMKNDLYTDYVLLTKEIKKLDLSKDDNLKKYEQLNNIRINYVKAFHNIAKTPIEDKQTLENNIDGFK